MIRTKVVALFLLVIILLLLVLQVFTKRMERLFQEEIDASDTGALRYYAGTLESEFETVELFFMEQRLHQSIYLNMEKTQGELDRYLTAQDIKKTFENSLHEEEFLDAMFFYYPADGTFVQSSYGYAAEGDSAFVVNMKELLGKNSLLSFQWNHIILDDTIYLYYIIPIHESWIGGVVKTDSVLAQNGLSENEAFDQILLLDLSVQPAPFSEKSQEEQISTALRKEEEKVRLNGQDYVINHCYLERVGLELVGLKQQENIMKSMWVNNLDLLLLIVTVVVFGIAMIIILWRSLLKPLSNITEGMKQMQKGNFSYQLKNEKDSEFAQITTTFNTLGHEIEQLKIAVYEEQLEHQKTELQFLQSQLDPHFLINCLNNLRTLVLEERFQDFQVMLIEMGTYLRGLMTMREQIPLEQEIKNVSAYLKLQKIRYQNNVFADINIYEELYPVSIPVHVIQTFVENAVKYSELPDRSLHITITGDLSDDRDGRIVLTVSDDGPGFSPADLEQIQHDRVVKKENRECIGIINARKRLNLQFGDDAVLICRNQDSGGAIVQIEMPIQKGIL